MRLLLIFFLEHLAIYCVSQESFNKVVYHNNGLATIITLYDKAFLFDFSENDPTLITTSKNRYIDDDFIWDYHDGYVYFIPIPDQGPYPVPGTYRTTAANIQSWYAEHKIDPFTLAENPRSLRPSYALEIDVPFTPLLMYRDRIGKSIVFVEFIVDTGVFEMVIYDSSDKTIYHWALDASPDQLKEIDEVYSYETIEKNGRKEPIRVELLQNYTSPEWILRGKHKINAPVNSLRAFKGNDYETYAVIDNQVNQMSDSGLMYVHNIARATDDLILFINKDESLACMVERNEFNAALRRDLSKQELVKLWESMSIVKF